jgi:hypothetical protein
MEYDLNNHVIRANVGGRFCDGGQAVISNMIRPILQSFILPFSGIKTIHGAVLTKEGRTVFLSGRGGAGKTTAALQLMRAGYTLLSDDGPFFFVDGGKAYALGSLDYVHFTADTLRLFSELQAHIVGDSDSRAKFAARISDIQPHHSWKDPHEVTHYVQLRRQRGLVAPRLTKISRNIVHRSLLDESMVIFRPRAFRVSPSPFTAYTELVFDLLMRVVQGAETHQLEFSDHHLTEIPALIEQL